MDTQKSKYCRPSTQLAVISCESPICAGSVDFNGDADHQITINNQEFADDQNNDFTSSSWDMNSGGSNL